MVFGLVRNVTRLGLINLVGLKVVNVRCYVSYPCLPLGCGLLCIVVKSNILPGFLSTYFQIEAH
jgi:hypothetical protein